MINPDEANLQGKVGWLFGGMSIFASIAAWMYVPETGHRTTDESVASSSLSSSLWKCIADSKQARSHVP